MDRTILPADTISSPRARVILDYGCVGNTMLQKAEQDYQNALEFELRLVNLEFAKEMRRFTRHETAYNESDQDPIVFSATKIRDDAFVVGFEAFSSCDLDKQ